MIRFLAATETMQWVVYAIGALTIVFVVFRPSLRKKDPLNSSNPKLSMAQLLRFFETTCDALNHSPDRLASVKRVLRPVLFELVFRLFDESPARAAR